MAGSQPEIQGSSIEYPVGSAEIQAAYNDWDAILVPIEPGEFSHPDLLSPRYHDNGVEFNYKDDRGLRAPALRVERKQLYESAHQITVTFTELDISTVITRVWALASDGLEASYQKTHQPAPGSSVRPIRSAHGYTDLQVQPLYGPQLTKLHALHKELLHPEPVERGRRFAALRKFRAVRVVARVLAFGRDTVLGSVIH